MNGLMTTSMEDDETHVAPRPLAPAMPDVGGSPLFEIGEIPPFEPHPLLRNGHAQTLAATWFPGRGRPQGPGFRWTVDLADGDRIILHDHSPATWRIGDPAALLVHGLAGCHSSGYMRRISAHLQARGVRSFRIDMRNCGAGHGLAQRPYHAGRSEDIQAAVECITGHCPGSPINVAGFSLGGNMVLKWLGEGGARLAKLVPRAMAINPPVDLLRCTMTINEVAFGIYDRHFARMMFTHVRRGPMWSDKLALARAPARPRRVIDFDDLFTASMSGFKNARHYYEMCSAIHVIEAIRVPTLILSSRDDPMIPASMLEELPLQPSVKLYLADHGGHLGYIARRGIDPDRRWMDWRVVNWLAPPRLDRLASTR